MALRLTFFIVVVFLAAFGFVGVAAAQTPRALRYVSTTGKDTNPGTIAWPWRTLQHAANVAGPGTEIFARAGVYNERVMITLSGRVIAPITFRNYPGETAVVDGTGISPDGETGLIDIENVSFIHIEGLEIRNYASTDINDEPIGIYVAGACRGIELTGNTIHNIVTTVTTSAGDALGIAIYGTSATLPINDIVVSGNTLTNLVTGFSESLTLSGNVMNFMISDNVIHDNDNIGIDVAGYEGTAPDASVDHARYGTIIGNTVYNITSVHNPAYQGAMGADGIYVDGGDHVVIEDNLVHNTDIGIEMASEHAGRVTSYVTSRSNIVYASNLVGITIGGYAANVGGTDHCIAVNNTLYDNDTAMTGSGEFQIQYHATNNLFENNLVYANTQGLMVNSFTTSPTPPAVIDHNLYFCSIGSDNTTWQWDSVTYTGTTAWVAGTGNDHHSTFADPKFISLTTPNFRLQSTSPAINTGLNLGPAIEGPYDIALDPRVENATIDLGAYE